MEVILSLAFKNNSTTFIEFLPRIDFGLLSFGSSGEDSLDGSGFKREQADIAVQADEPQPAAQADMPSGLSLDDVLIPEGTGALEQIYYNSERKIIEPQTSILSYLFFDLPRPRSSLPYTNPKYLVYAHFMPRYVVLSGRGYSRIKYSEETQYKPIEQPKPHFPAADYSVPYVAPVSLLDSREQSYERFRWNSFAAKPRTKGKADYKSENVQPVPLVSRLSVPAGAESASNVWLPSYSASYQPYTLPQNVPTYAKKFLGAQAKPYKATAPVQLPTPKILSDKQTPSLQPKSEAKEYYETSKILSQNQELRANAQNLAALDTSVRDAHRQLQSAPAWRQIYYAHQHIPALPSVPYRPQQKTKIGEPALELRLIALADRAYEKPETKHIYLQNQRYDRVLPQTSINSRQALYAIVKSLHHNPLLKIGKFGVARTYGIQQRWINLPSSSFLQTRPFYQGKTKTLEEKTINDGKQELEKNAEYEVKTQGLEKESYSGKENESSGKPEYPSSINEIKEEAGKPAKDASKNETQNQGKKTEDDSGSGETQQSKSSAPAYAAAAGLAAGAGLVALAGKTFSLFRRRKRKYNSVAEITDYQSKIIPIIPIGAVPTIDNVVAPTRQTEHKRFNPIFRNNMAAIVAELKGKLGYEKVSMYFEDNETGEFYGLDENVQMSTPSLNKVAITFAAAYMAERNRIDITKKVHVDEKWVHPREKKYHPEYEDPKTEFEYQGTRKSTNRESSNTEANHLLKLIGNGDIGLGIKRVNDVMDEVGLYEIKIKAPYQRGERYDENVATAKSITKLMNILKSGKYLNGQHTREIMEDLEGTRTKDIKEQITEGFRELFSKPDIGIKQTLWEHGMGYTFYIGNKYSGAIVFDRPNEVLYRDELTARGEERKPTSIFKESRRYITKINQLLSQQMNPKKLYLEINPKAA
ncbi:serine hydrolase [Candidatus Woesearchaeota archaeon]|nr:serine hydrolase [Candidatus Woesearchaeota archaeon]